MPDATQVEDGRVRCFGGPGDPLMMSYHDEEWGVPVHDDRKHFEMLILDGFQAGLSWRTILHKREAFREAFQDFDPVEVAAYTDEDVARLLANAGIVRNWLKIAAAISNAEHFIQIQREHGSFDKYIWQFTGYKTLRNPKGVSWDTMPASTPESDAMSKDLRKRGFRFVGTTICYAYMQSAGIVNDHVNDCWRVTRR